MDSTIALRRFRVAVAAFSVAWTAGALAFALAVDESPLDALYRSTVTISLTGIDNRPDTSGGEITTILLIFAGMAIYGYIAGALVEVVARGVVTGAWSERRRRALINALSDHYICGYGGVGQAVAQERGEIWIKGSGTNDGDLEAAGIARARGLVACADSDSDNLFITVSARTMRPNLLIVARASEPDAARKLLRAGADRVTQPFTTAGGNMAKLVLRPQVAAFLDVVTSEPAPKCDWSRSRCCRDHRTPAGRFATSMSCGRREP